MRKVTVLAVSAVAAAVIAVPAIAGAQEDAPADTTTEEITEPGFRRGGGAKFETIAEVIGITADELREQLVAGATIAEIAEANGTSIDDVADAIVAQMETHLADHVADGDLTQEQADARLADSDDRIDDLLNGTLPLGGGRGGARGPGGHGGPGGMDGFGQRGPGMPFGADLEALLGIDGTELMEQLQAGSTVAEIAEANGVSTDELIETMVTAITDHLADAVADGYLTQEQADERLVQATERVTDMVNGEAFGAGGFGGHGPRGAGEHGGRGGFGPGPVAEDINA